MAHRTLPVSATDDEIRDLVVEWSELLAEQRYQDALAMFPSSSDEIEWTPQALEQTISGYGVIAPEDDAVTLDLLAEHGVERFRITTLIGRPDRDEIITNKIKVDRMHSFGLDPGRYVGMVHYDDVPLSGFRSDLTARFNILRVGSDRITLEFIDLHVM